MICTFVLQTIFLITFQMSNPVYMDYTNHTVFIFFVKSNYLTIDLGVFLALITFLY